MTQSGDRKYFKQKIIPSKPTLETTVTCGAYYLLLDERDRPFSNGQGYIPIFRRRKDAKSYLDSLSEEAASLLSIKKLGVTIVK